MILNNNKYIKFMNILFAVGFSTIFSYAQNFSYETSNENLSYINKYASSYVDLRIVKEEKDIKPNNLSIEEKALEIARNFAPEKVEEISTEYINDELGTLTVINVYLDFDKELNDEDYIKASNEANEAINTKNILIKYL